MPALSISIAFDRFFVMVFDNIYVKVFNKLSIHWSISKMNMIMLGKRNYFCK